MRVLLDFVLSFVLLVGDLLVVFAGPAVLAPRFDICGGAKAVLPPSAAVVAVHAKDCPASRVHGRLLYLAVAWVMAILARPHSPSQRFLPKGQKVSTNG